MSKRDDNPVITAELKDEVDLDNINFLSNEQLKERLEEHDRHARAIRRSAAHQRGSPPPSAQDRFLGALGPGLLAIFPCSWLPDYRPGEIPSDRSKSKKARM